MTKKFLTRDEILKAPDLKREVVQAWGGQVWVRAMTGAERDKFEGMLVQFKGKEQTVNFSNVRAKLCSLTICDEAGNRLFTEEDVQALSQKSSAELQKVFVVAQRLSGLTNEDVEELADGLENPLDGSVSG